MTISFRSNDARLWLLLLAVFYVLVAVAVGLLLAAAPALSASLIDAPLLNRALNAVIVGAFAFGLVLIQALVVRAARQESKINRFCRHNLGREEPSAPSSWSLQGLGRSAIGARVELLDELARSGGAYDAAVVADTLAEREDPWVSLARFTASVLVLLGLLGTFVGLLLTISGVTEVVDGLQVSPGDDIEAFLIPLKDGLRQPLSGMSVAFSTSLLGLAGSLVLGAGALALTAAQGAWMSKLEEVTTLYLLPAYQGRLAGPAAAPAATAGASSVAGMVRMEAGARALADAQSALGQHVALVAGASERMSGTVGDLRDRVADLQAHIERVESVLARLADEQGAGRSGLNDLAVKVSDLSGTAAAVRADVRDGSREVVQELRAATRGLQQGVSGGLGSVAAILAQGPGVAELREAVEALRTEMVRDTSARRQDGRDVVDALRRIEALLAGAPGPQGPRG